MTISIATKLDPANTQSTPLHLAKVNRITKLSSTRNVTLENVSASHTPVWAIDLAQHAFNSLSIQ